MEPVVLAQRRRRRGHPSIDVTESKRHGGQLVPARHGMIFYLEEAPVAQLWVVHQSVALTGTVSATGRGRPLSRCGAETTSAGMHP